MPPHEQMAVNTLRFLSADMVQAANSGHPGLPMGAAAMAYVLWAKFLKFYPGEPSWPNRDRFILSAGHGSALLYSLLHLSGYNLPLEQLKNFRQWASRTPGHPEYGLTPGVEATTGPLGQGMANAVGMAIAESFLAARYNRPEFDILNHYTYVLAGDGDMMEGISYEAASLAGHLKLGKLIVLYDSNRITIEGSTALAFTENVRNRFEAMGWHTEYVPDGNDIAVIERAIETARQESARPSLIEVKTEIGFGAPNKQGKASAHGEPLGEQELLAAKRHLGWPERSFYIPEEVSLLFRDIFERGKEKFLSWEQKYSSYARAFPSPAGDLNRILKGDLPLDWETIWQTFGFDTKPAATRTASGKIINHMAGHMPELMGGSADLAPSTKTILTGESDYSSENKGGRNIRFGVREHAMGGILNGLAYHGGVRPYGGTFLVFSDYMRPSIRLAALSKLKVIYVFTHDSLAVGEDGPTHQPVEHLLSLRAIPGLTVIRPADTFETALGWRWALETASGPTALILTRQDLPALDLSLKSVIREGLPHGGYILAEGFRSFPDVTLIATGSEVHLALEARSLLEKENIAARVVSLPAVTLFQKQDSRYIKSVIPENIPTLVMEAGVTLGWRTYWDNDSHVCGVDKFGASAPGSVVMRNYDFKAENILDKVREMLKNKTDG